MGLNDILSRNDVPVDVKQLIESYDKQLRQVEYKQLMSFFSYCVMPTIIMNNVGDFVVYNNTMEELTGYSREETYNIDILFEKLFPDGDYHSRFNELNHFLQDKNGSIQKNIFKITRKDGKRRFIEFFTYYIHSSEKLSDLQAIQGIDITDHLKTEKELMESKERWSSFTDNSPDFITIVDRSGVIQYINRVLPDLKMDEVTGTSMYDYQPPESQELHKTLLEKAFKTGETQSLQSTGTGPNNTLFWYETEILPIKRENRVISAILITRDVTDRKIMEKKLQESEEKFSRVFYLSPTPMAITRIEDGYIYDVNNSFCQVLEYDREELIGQRTVNLGIWKESEERESIIENIQKKRIFRNVENNIYSKSGKKHIMLTSGIITDINDTKPRLITIASDITEHKRLENTLKESEGKLRTIMNTLQTGVIIINCETYRIVDVNLKAIDLIGAPRNEIINRKCHKFICPTEEGQCPILDLGQQFDQSERILLKATGEKIPVIKSTKLMTIDEHEYLIESFIDISTRKQTEELIRIQRDLGVALSSTNDLAEALDLILASTLKIEGIDSGGIYLVDKGKGGLVLANHIGLSQKFVENVYFIDEKDPRFKIVMRKKAIFAPFTQIVTSADETQLSEGLLSLGVIPVLFENDLVAVLNIASHTMAQFTNNAKNSLEAIATQIGSVIARINAEKLFREESNLAQKYLDIAAVIMVAIDSNQQVTLINKKGVEFLGYKEKDIIGENWFDNFIPAKYKDEAKKVFQELMYSKTELTEYFEHPIITKDGEERIIAWYNTILEDNEGNITGTLSSGEDITERKKAEYIKKELEERRKDFIYMTTHELRTPLTVLTGYCDFLYEQNEFIDNRRRENIYKILKNNLNRFERLIRDVSYIVQLEKGQFNLEKTEVNISAFLKSTLEPYEHLLKDQFTFQEYSNNVKIIVSADSCRIQQVIENIINNAINHTPKDDRRIVVTMKVIDDNVQITINDNGAGIAPTDLERIFEQFVSIPTEYNASGTGIGLYLAKEILRAHQGTIIAQSPGKGYGSKFIIELPIKKS